MEDYQKITREDFMKFFRDSDKLNELTADDRVEVFISILLGSSDITVDLLNDLLSNYCVEDIEVIALSEGEKQ